MHVQGLKVFMLNPVTRSEMVPLAVRLRRADCLCSLPLAGMALALGKLTVKEIRLTAYKLLVQPCD